MKRLRTPLFFLITTISFSPAFSQTQTCDNVYAQSTRNIDAKTKIETQENAEYSENCGSDGKVKQSKLNADFSGKWKLISGNLNITKEEALQEEHKFCDKKMKEFAASSFFTSLNNSVVVEALRSFNQCKLIESKGLLMSHTANTTDLVLRGDYNPATTNVEVQKVTFQQEAGSCIDNATGNRLTTGTRPFKTTGPFSISCGRVGQRTRNGISYPRFEVIVATNHGNYPVTLLADEVANLDLASEYKRRLAEQEAQRLRDLAQYTSNIAKVSAQLTSEKAAGAKLQASINGINVVRSWAFTYGDGQTVPCEDPRNYPPRQVYVDQQCAPNRGFYYQVAPQTAYGFCGYYQYHGVCVAIP